MHFPLAFLCTAYGLDILYPLYSYLPGVVTGYLPAAVEIPRLSYYALSVGLLTSLPAISSGVQQALKMVKAQGIYEADNKTIKPKFKVVALHAAANDVVFAASAYVWWCKRSAYTLSYAPDTWMTWAGVVLFAALGYAANLGGTLTYNYGMGLSLAKGKGKSS